MARKRTQEAVPFPEEAAERVARIIGPNSACRAALDRLAELRAGGQGADLLRAGEMILVVPRGSYQ